MSYEAPKFSLPMPKLVLKNCSTLYAWLLAWVTLKFRINTMSIALEMGQIYKVSLSEVCHCHLQLHTHGFMLTDFSMNRNIS